MEADMTLGDRGIKLQAKLAPADQDTFISPDELAKWKKQVDLLQGCDDKSLFRDLEDKKKVI
jgi:hypothetical protein